jgi:uncharacterized membrane protein SpoIIM required for sporulation
MLEMLISPQKAERSPWELFFVGLFYASVSILLVHWIFSKDAVLSQYSGILIVTFTVMFSMPFIYYTIKLEESKITERRGTLYLLKEHERAIFAFLWLFMGFVIALSFWYMVLPTNEGFRAQIETYCVINQPTDFQGCANKYTTGQSINADATSPIERLITIFSNNVYVLIFTLLFSLIFGAGVIFILAWNASVIAAAIGIFANSSLTQFPLAILRFMIHGLPEIASYFIVALAGGMVSIAVIKHEIGTNKIWEILQDSVNLVIIAVAVLFIAALIEVYITPWLF